VDRNLEGDLLVRRTIGFVAIVGALAALAPAGGSGQVTWEAPSLMRPGAPSGFSVLLLAPDYASDLGALATWRGRPAPAGVGFRAGLANRTGGGLDALFGLDVSGSLGTVSPPDGPGVMWWSGAGLGVGRDARISFPLGLVLGWAVRSEDASFQPYVGGHVSLDVLTGAGGDVRLNGAVDLGVDLSLRRGWAIRFGAAVGRRSALAIGVRLPTSE
jgi:hypothetical protein